MVPMRPKYKATENIAAYIFRWMDVLMARGYASQIADAACAKAMQHDGLEPRKCCSPLEKARCYSEAKVDADGGQTEAPDSRS